MLFLLMAVVIIAMIAALYLFDGLFEQKGRNRRVTRFFVFDGYLIRVIGSVLALVLLGIAMR